MLTNFIFSISIAMPIFLVMFVGYILKRKGIIDDGFVKIANIIIFNVALPIKLFDNVLHTSINDYFDLKFILFIVVGTILSVVFTWFYGRIFIKQRSQLGAFIHGSFRGNIIYVGFSLMENITGTIGLKAPLVIAFIIPLYNILAVIILKFTNVNGESKANIKDTFKSIITNPLIIGTLAGIIGSMFNLKLPIFMVRSMGYFKSLATPLALITIGATFSLRELTHNIVPSLSASLIKLIINPTITVILAILIGFSNEDILLIYILFGVPSATVSYIMTAAMNGDKDLSSSIIMMTTLLSVFSMTVFVFIFKTIGIV